MRRRLLAALAIGVAGVATAGPAAAAASSATPYRDPSAAGSIGLCDRAGHQITHGSVTSVPFAWRAVSSVAAPSGYGVAGATATLLAYQPRNGVAPGEWSGDQLTSASRYSTPAHPTAAATQRDESLQGFLTEFRPAWDGLLQLRLYLGAPDQPVYSQTYPTLDIKVTGNTWRAVDSKPVSCAGGRAISLESIVLSPTSSTRGAGSAHHKAPDATSTTTSPASPAATASAVAATSEANGSSDEPIVLVVIIAGVLALGFGYLTRRHIIATRSAPSKKGL